MKYFTFDFFFGKNQEKNSQNPANYQKYLESIASQLPPDFLKIHRDIRLNDSTFEYLKSDFNKKKVVLALNVFDWRKVDVKLDVRLEYLNVLKLQNVIEGTAEGLNAWVKGNENAGDVIFDEVEVMPDQMFEHRLLFATGMEIIINFSGFKLYMDHETGQRTFEVL